MAEDIQKSSPLSLLRIVAAALLCLCGSSVAVPAAERAEPKRGAGESGAPPDKPSGSRLMLSGKSVHLSCSRSLRDMARNREECFGNVYIRRPSELLTADYAVLDLNTDELHAEGNVVYFTPDTVIYGSKMDFNFVTETGVIEDGRIESDKYQLLGEKIERLAPDHFRAQDGEYTTCRDCPASWKIVGRTIDLQVNGYAHLTHVFIKVNEAPSVYLPYMFFPVKTQRQSGLLFPKISPSGSNGFSYIQPFYWAISRSTDATIGLGFYSLRGLKSENQFRYVLSGRSHGELNAFYLRDKQFVRDPYYNRWALNYQHNIELPWRFEQKLYYLDASDRDYSSRIGDIPGARDSALVSEAGLSRAGRDLSVWLSAKRVRNQITPGLTGFDYNTVQVLPSISVATADHRVGETFPLHWGLSTNYTRFWRLGPSFDPIYDPAKDLPPTNNFFLPGQTPLRRAQRFSIVPELYYTAKLADVLEVVPSVQYRTFYYLFDEGFAAPTARGYLLAQNEVATTIETIYRGKVKHKFRPSLTYSNIPFFQQSNEHPFIQQIKTGGNEFDEFDIVPISNDQSLYFVPLGNSLTYRFGNKFIFKEGGSPATYKKVVDFTAGQNINFIEYRKYPPTDRQPLSRLFADLVVDTVRTQAHLQYYYYPYRRASTYSLTANYIFAKYLRRLLVFERSVGLNFGYDQVITGSKGIGGNFVWSFNDTFGITGGISYTFPATFGGPRSPVESPGLINMITAGVTYQSPSQCYRLSLKAAWKHEDRKVAVSYELPVNLTGEGFANLQEGGGLVPR